MSQIKLMMENIAETSSCALSAGGVNPEFPLARLYDRNIARPCKGTTNTFTVVVDQGSNNYSATHYIIPAGHNLTAYGIEYSSNGSSYATVYSGAAPSGQILRTFSPLAYRYWRLVFTTSDEVNLCEVSLSTPVTLTALPQRPYTPFEKKPRVAWGRTSGGQDRATVLGVSTRLRKYSLRMDGTDKTLLDTASAAWGGYKPFWLCDHEGSWIFGRLNSPLDIREVASNRYTAIIDFEEVAA